MTYLCGLNFPGFYREPQINCDGCGSTIIIQRNPPPKWFLDGKPKRGWRLVRCDEKRTDYCPNCLDKAEEA